MLGEALGDALGAVGDAVGDTLGGQVKADQSYGHAVLAESEFSICRLLQSPSEVVPPNISDMLFTPFVSNASGWLNATE